MATAIFRRAFFRLSLCLSLLLTVPARAGISLAIDDIRHPAFAADGISIVIDTGRRGDADIRLDRLQVAGLEYRKLSLHCRNFVLDLRRIECPYGEIRRTDQRGQDRPPLPLSFSYRYADGDLALTIVGADATSWSPVIKRLRAWKPEGKIDLVLTADRRQAQLGIAARKLRFGNKTGDIAGEGIDISLAAEAKVVQGQWHWTARLVWPDGELYVAPWYRRAGLALEASGVLTPAALDVTMAHFSAEGVGGLDASFRWNRGKGALDSFGFVTEPLELSTAFSEWLQPWLDQSAVPKVYASGKARFAGSWSGGAWQSFYAGLENARLVDGTDYIEFAGMNAQIPWQRGEASEAEFSVKSARLGELPLGSFSIPLHLRDNEARLDQLSIPLLDGRLYVDELLATRLDTGWQGRFSGGIENVSMPKLTHALKLPVMAGTFTAHIPAAVYQDRVLSLGGALAIQVFDGGILVDHLKMIDPLSEGQRFTADVLARNLDLGALTQAFSFGSILGRLDIDIAGLELAGWRPVRFDARTTSSPGDYRRAISRGALRDISALGGAAGAAAVSLSPANLFNTFEYEKIGFGCSLRGGVCHFDGIESAGDGYVVVKGRGLPTVQVIGYNRRIDWDLLVSRVRAVIAGKTKAVIE
ncbi:MAG: YdbH domain-containing protein [Gammaproteobacteria bacterium]|nr:YdbH domain-containing protein [Gammaproteobacteria bacterium]MBU1415586.1 YdbH domain-containing protein [Gammaproteobacteria bacterium]